LIHRTVKKAEAKAEISESSPTRARVPAGRRGIPKYTQIIIKA
jgi:hypothetical protein